jgi:hypothetical protein
VALLYAIIDPDPTKNRYLLSATLEPDLSYDERRRVLDQLRPHTPFGRSPVLELPTDPTLQAATTYHWAQPPPMEEPQVRQVWDTLQVSAAAGLGDAVALLALIEGEGLLGDVTFTLPDGIKVNSNLVLDTGIVGPWDRGGVEVTVAAGKATLLNRLEQPVDVFELAGQAGIQSAQRVPVDVRLEPGASAEVSYDGPADDVWAAYRPTGGPRTLAQLGVFVEDLLGEVTFVNLVNHANHGLSALEVHTRLRGSAQTHTVDLAEGATVAVTLTLPLTTYLSGAELEFQVVKRFAAQDAVITPWQPWHLSEQGNVISITWELIQ